MVSNIRAVADVTIISTVVLIYNYLFTSHSIITTCLVLSLYSIIY